MNNNRRRKRFAANVALVSTGMLIVGCGSSDSDPTESEGAAYLSIQVGEDVMNADGRLSFVSDGTVQWFTDRPDRDAGSATLEELTGLWDDGRTFSDDPPNAAVVIDSDEPVVLELIDIESGKRHPLPAAPSELLYSADFAPNGKKIAMTLAGSTAPPDLWQFDLASEKYTRLTWSPHNGVNMAALVRPELARSRRVLPLRTTPRCLVVALADPLDLGAVDDLQFQSGRRVEAQVATEAAILDGAISGRALYDGRIDVGAALARLAADR